MEDRTVHVESFSFARRALERAKGEYFRVVTARRPAWQQHALRTKERRMKELDKEKQKMEAQRSRSAELFKHEKELNSVLSKKREETLALQVMIRREEMKRQLGLEETQQHEDGLRRNRERAIASENDQLRAKLEALTAKREEEKLQHERALAAMRDAEDKVLSRTAQHRFDNGTMETTNAWTPNVPGKSSTASQGHHKSPLERMQERTHKFEGKMFWNPNYTLSRPVGAPSGSSMFMHFPETWTSLAVCTSVQTEQQTEAKQSLHVSAGMFIFTRTSIRVFMRNPRYIIAMMPIGGPIVFPRTVTSTTYFANAGEFGFASPSQFCINSP